MATHPEILAALLSVEALEDNEVLIVEGARHISRINDPKHRSTFESISKPNTVSMAEIDLHLIDYSNVGCGIIEIRYNDLMIHLHR